MMPTEVAISKTCGQKQANNASLNRRRISKGVHKQSLGGREFFFFCILRSITKPGRRNVCVQSLFALPSFCIITNVWFSLLVATGLRPLLTHQYTLPVQSVSDKLSLLHLNFPSKSIPNNIKELIFEHCLPFHMYIWSLFNARLPS